MTIQRRAAQKQARQSRKTSLFLLIALVLTTHCAPASPAPLVTRTPLAPTVTTATHPAPTVPASRYFELENGLLRITTPRLELHLASGAITYLKDQATGTLLVNSASPARPGSFTTRHPDGSTHTRSPQANPAQTTLTVTAPNRARLTYAQLEGGEAGSLGQFHVDITVEETSGEILLQFTGQEESPQAEIISIDLPISNPATQAVILGNGSRVTHDSAAIQIQTSEVAYGLYSPTMAVLEQVDAVAAIWSETSTYDPEFIQLEHQPASDQLTLHGGRSALQANPSQLVSPPWIIGTYPTWLEAARRWRERFEQRTGALPLWENRVPWVQNIHAVYDSTLQDYGGDPQKYAALARVTPPAQTLFFLWNGDRLVLFGDPTLVAEITRPSESALKQIRAYGWPLLLYHPYTLIYSEQGAARRLEKLARLGWLPADYQFTPDYGGSAEGWQAYWDAIKTPYAEDGNSYVLHPGAKRFKEYLVHNFGAYAEKFQAQGAYFDILGANEEFRFSESQKLIAGENYVLGEIGTLQQLEQNLPGLAVMSEYQAPWLIPYVFFAWEGSATHLAQNQYVHAPINHPLRTALIGSYTWGRESNEDHQDAVSSALLGTLPQISMPGDAGISDELAAWSQARASLFCEEELFNDLPGEWQPGVLAYYRSLKTRRWITFQPVGTSYGYVEILADGSQKIRLVLP